MYKKILDEYAKILERNMRSFSLETLDIAFLAKVNKKTIAAVLARTGGIELHTLEAISQVFGLHYYQFGDPNFIMPTYDDLPAKTKTRIAFRKKQGAHLETSYDQRLLNEKITVILAKYNKGDQFLTEHIVTQLFEDFKEEVSTSIVGKRLVNSLNEYVLQTKKTHDNKGKRGRKPYFFQLIKEIPVRILAEAKEKLDRYCKRGG